MLSWTNLCTILCLFPFLPDSCSTCRQLQHNWINVILQRISECSVQHASDPSINLLTSVSLCRHLGALEPIPAAIRGKPWMNLQFIAGPTYKDNHSLTVTPKDNLSEPFHLSPKCMFSQCMGMLEKPVRHVEKMQTPHRKAVSDLWWWNSKLNTLLHPYAFNLGYIRIMSTANTFKTSLQITERALNAILLAGTRLPRFWKSFQAIYARSQQKQKGDKAFLQVFCGRTTS